MRRLLPLAAALLCLVSVRTVRAGDDEGDEGHAPAPPAAGARYTDRVHPFSITPPPAFAPIPPPAANIKAQWVDARRNLSLAVAWARMDTTAWKGTSRLTLRVTLEAGMRLSTRGFRKLAARAFEYRELPGYEIEYEFLSDEGTELRTLMRYYFTGDGQYMVLVMGPPAEFARARGELLAAADSVELTAKWKGGWGGAGGVGAAQAGALIGIGVLSVIAVLIWLVARSATRQRPQPQAFLAGRGAHGPAGPPPPWPPSSPPPWPPPSPPSSPPSSPLAGPPPGPRPR